MLVLAIAVLAVMLVLVIEWVVVAGYFESLPKYSLPND